MAGFGLVLLATIPIASSEVIYRGSMTAKSQVGSGMQEVQVCVTEENVNIEMTGMDMGWFGFGFGSSRMDDAYSIVAWKDTDGNDVELKVDEYILSKPDYEDCSDESNCGGDRCLSGKDDKKFCENTQTKLINALTVIDDTSNGFLRTVRLQRPRSNDGPFEFGNSNDNELEIDMISASADYYENQLAYHGSNYAGNEQITLKRKNGCCNDANCNGNKVCGAEGVCEKSIVPGGCASDDECTNGNKNVCKVATGKCVKCLVDGECNGNKVCENEKCVPGARAAQSELFMVPGALGDLGETHAEERALLTTTDALLGAALLIAAAFAMDQLWRSCKSDGELKEVKNHDATPLLTHARV